jgi:hypothetical protein
MAKTSRRRLLVSKIGSASARPFFLLAALAFGFAAYRQQGWIAIPIVVGVAIALTSIGEWRARRRLKGG